MLANKSLPRTLVPTIKTVEHLVVHTFLSRRTARTEAPMQENSKATWWALDFVDRLEMDVAFTFLGYITYFTIMESSGMKLPTFNTNSLSIKD